MKIRKVTEKDIEEILSNYNIGSYRSHNYIFTGGNQVYKLITSRGIFILKIFENSMTSEIKYQIKLMEFLNNTKVLTPKIINTKKDKGLLIWNGKRIAIQEFAQGKTVHYANKKLAKDMGYQYGLLDKTLVKFGKSNYNSCQDNPFKLIRWHLNSIFELNVKEESKKISKEISRLNKDKLKIGITHGDLCEGNFLVKDNKISAIIDWEDVGENFIAYEVAIPIIHNLVTLKQVRKDLISIFLREYQKHMKFNAEEKKAIYLFVKYRALSAGSWCYDQIKKHPNNRKELLKWTKIMLDKYKTFSKISVEEFMEILK